METHPTLNITILAVLVLVAVGIAIYWILYTRGMRSKQAALNEKGRLPVSREEGISVATEGKEKAGRTGSIS